MLLVNHWRSNATPKLDQVEGHQPAPVCLPASPHAAKARTWYVVLARKDRSQLIVG